MAQSIANRLRKLAGNRRDARRRKAQRRVHVLFEDFDQAAHGRTGQSRQAAPLEGYTRDISTGGIAFIIPSLAVDGGSIVRDGTTLDITLELPAASVRMRAVPVRCEALADSQRGSLIAARITSMSDADRSRLTEYLRRLGSSIGDFAPLLSVLSFQF
jgi:hypothetical protein